MLNKKIKRIMTKFVDKVGTASAKNDVNQTCACLLYQPKQPKSLKKNEKDS